jgi:azurin
MCLPCLAPRRLLRPLLLASLALAIPPAPGQAPDAEDPNVITITTLRSQMRYDVDLIRVKPGQIVKIMLVNADDLPHNLVICSPDTDIVAMANAQMEQPELALQRDWLPDDDRILHHTKMLAPGESEVIEFKAPDELVDLPFVCTFPGHAPIMRGMLEVRSMGPTLQDLGFSLYLGKWDKLPDFIQLEPHRSGNIPDNTIAIELDDYKNDFGVVFTGIIEAPVEGEYEFLLSSDDGSKLFVNGSLVADHDGVHAVGEIKKGKIKLAKGTHQLRLEYFQAQGEIGLFAAWSGPTFSHTPLSRWVPDGWGDAPRKQDDHTGIPLVADADPIIYRNFIEGAGNRPIGVGFPQGFNVAWSAESMDLVLVWRGAFIDAARHWRNRGGGHQPPLGYDLFATSNTSHPPLATLDAPDAAWPQGPEAVAPLAWLGYLLDDARAPIFRYSWQDLEIRDSFQPEGNGQTIEGILHRTVEIAGTIPPNTWFKVLSSEDIKPLDDGFLIGGRLFLKADGAQLHGDHLRLLARPSIQLSYQWR